MNTEKNRDDSQVVPKHLLGIDLQMGKYKGKTDV